ncbi:MAG: IclR family transcriptional regulator [Rhizobiales bacterium]|nr:IclR family transcriptional regulator [Hyphomicrobiales bacterium]
MARLKSDLEIRSDGRNAVADRAIEILLSFTDDRPVLTAGELCEANGMSRSTIYRYLTSLRAGGFIAEEPGRGFRLGPKLIEMARIARKGNSILEIAEPHIHQLANRCGEIVQLVERVGRQTIMLDNIESKHRIGITYLRGQVLPSPLGASAKVLTAFAPPEEFEELLRSVDLQAYTPRSIVDPQELRRQLELVRANGYAYNDEELDEGIRAVAAPIFGRFSVRYSVAIVGPTFRLTDEKLPEFIEMVKDTATQISRSLKEHET